MLSNGTNHHKHLADLLTALGQLTDLEHREIHLARKLVDAVGGSFNGLRTFPHSLIDMPRRISSHCGIPGYILRGGTHLLSSCCDLLNLLELLLHTTAGLASYGRSLISRAASVINGPTHFGNDGL
ncbi:hypothetical protein D3C80_1779590 [compost metagenome]